MRPKEINTVIQEQTESFFVKEGFKYFKKDMGFLKKENSHTIRYGFSYLEYHPEYDYDINMYAILNEVETIYSKVDGSGIIGVTYVFPLSYFIDSTNYINNNPKFPIIEPTDVQIFSTALIENYEKYVRDFIPFIIQPKNMLNFLLSEIATGKQYAANDENVLIRTLILLKLTKSPLLTEKLKEFKENLKNCNENLKQKFHKQMDDVVNGNY